MFGREERRYPPHTYTFGAGAGKKLEKMAKSQGKGVNEVLADGMMLANIFYEAKTLFVELDDGSVTEVTRGPDGRFQVVSPLDEATDEATGGWGPEGV